MTEVNISFENVNAELAEYLEALVDDYDYSGGFDPVDLDMRHEGQAFSVKFKTDKSFSIDDDGVDDNLLEALIDRGYFFSTLYFELDDRDIDPDGLNVKVVIDGTPYRVEFSKDCELIPA